MHQRHVEPRENRREKGFPYWSAYFVTAQYESSTWKKTQKKDHVAYIVECESDI